MQNAQIWKSIEALCNEAESVIKNGEPVITVIKSTTPVWVRVIDSILKFFLDLEIRVHLRQDRIQQPMLLIFKNAIKLIPKC